MSDIEEASPDQKFEIEYRSGSLFQDVGPGTLFVHSCNAKGTWGKGIAVEFKNRYPGAYEHYEDYCVQHSAAEILGKSLIMVSSEQDRELGEGGDCYIGCLFTKALPGAPRSAAQSTHLKSMTKEAMCSLLWAVEEMMKEHPSIQIQEIRMPKINNGIFRVPWRETVQMLKDLNVPAGERCKHLRKIVVYTG